MPDNQSEDLSRPVKDHPRHEGNVTEDRAADAGPLTKLVVEVAMHVCVICSIYLVCITPAVRPRAVDAYSPVCFFPSLLFAGWN